MELTLSVVADVVMDEEALDAMLRDMTMRELEYLRSKITAVLERTSRSYA